MGNNHDIQGYIITTLMAALVWFVLRLIKGFEDGQAEQKKRIEATENKSSEAIRELTHTMMKATEEQASALLESNREMRAAIRATNETITRTTENSAQQTKELSRSLNEINSTLVLMKGDWSHENKALKARVDDLQLLVDKNDIKIETLRSRSHQDRNYINVIALYGQQKNGWPKINIADLPGVPPSVSPSGVKIDD